MVVPGGGGWEGWGVPSKLERPPWRFLGGVWEGWVSVCSLHVGGGGIAAVSPGQAPSPWPAAGGGLLRSPLLHLRCAGCRRSCLTVTRPHPAHGHLPDPGSPPQGASCRPLPGASAYGLCEG